VATSSSSNNSSAAAGEATIIRDQMPSRSVATDEADA
jgi:hypothetical protein